MKMNSIIMMICLISAFLFTGCQGQYFSDTIIKNNQATPEKQIYTEPLYSRWTNTELPWFVSGEGWELVIYGWQIGPDATVLMYTLSGATGKQLLSEMDFVIRDDLGNQLPLLEMLPLAQIGKLEAGVLNFQTRRLGAKDLYIQLTPKLKDQLLFVGLLAHYDQVISHQTDQPQSIYFYTNDEPWEQAGYRLSFLGWGVPNHLPVPGVVLETVEGLSEPIANARAPWSELPPGVSVTMLATLSIEDLETKSKEYLAMQFLTGRGVLAYFQGAVVSAISTPAASVPVLDNPYPTPF